MIENNPIQSALWQVCNKALVKDCVSLICLCRWKGDCGGAVQRLFPANLVEEYAGDEDAVKPNAEPSEAPIIQKGVIEIQGCTVGELYNIENTFSNTLQRNKFSKLEVTVKT